MIMDGIAALTIKKIPCSPRIIQQVNNSFRRLMNYRPTFVKEASAEITKMLGVTPSELKNISLFMQDTLMNKALDKNSEREKDICASPLFRPIDYETQPIFFADIHAAVTKFYGLHALKGKNVLQLAANWGPYMHFLHYNYDANTYGIDKNTVAVAYAKKAGLNFHNGDASNMDFFPDRFFNLVISLNFLDSEYLQLFCKETTTSFMEKALTEVHRVLKRGGLFISQDEEIENLNTVNLFSSFRSIDCPLSKTVNVLKK
jgi:SAM-dependent methyltransferase